MSQSKAVSSGLRKFARQLLTTTCLTAAAAGGAQAATFNESSLGSGDFNNTFATANALGSGITEVMGQINPAGDTDYFSISGLTPGASYNITGVYGAIARYGVLTSGAAFLNALATNPASMAGTVPGDGTLVVQVQQNEQLATYDLSITSSTGTPEPSTLAGVGLGLAGALALRRKRQK